MKYFEVTDSQGEEHQFTSVRALRAYLKEHPELPSAWRYWWCGNDLVECEEIPREEIFKGRARELKAGMTAQWAAAHGRLLSVLLVLLLFAGCMGQYEERAGAQVNYSGSWELFGALQLEDHMLLWYQAGQGPSLREPEDSAGVRAISLTLYRLDGLGELEIELVRTRYLVNSGLGGDWERALDREVLARVSSEADQVTVEWP